MTLTYYIMVNETYLYNYDYKIALINKII